MNEPKNNPTPPNPDGGDEVETLEKIIQKLQAEGKIKPVTGPLFGTAAADTPDSPVKHDAPATISASSTADTTESPAAQSNADDTEATAEPAQTNAEKADWSALLSGWDASPPSTRKDSTQSEPSAPEKPTQPEATPVADKQAADDIPQTQNEPADEAQAIAVSRKQIIPQAEAPLVSSDDTPWTLQQFFDGEIDLDMELQKRFPSMPMMVTAKFRTLGSQSRRRVASFQTSDGNATLVIDADMDTKVVQMSFTSGSMVALRFGLDKLTAMDRSRWLELMRREQGGLAFLWGPARWEDDYLICISRAYATNFYAFSPNNFDAAVRFTPSITKQLLDWLDAIWNEPDIEEDNDSPLLTW